MIETRGIRFLLTGSSARAPDRGPVVQGSGRHADRGRAPAVHAHRQAQGNRDRETLLLRHRRRARVAAAAAGPRGVRRFRRVLRALRAARAAHLDRLPPPKVCSSSSTERRTNQPSSSSYVRREHHLVGLPEGGVVPPESFGLLRSHSSGRYLHGISSNGRLCGDAATVHGGRRVAATLTFSLETLHLSRDTSISSKIVNGFRPRRTLAASRYVTSEAPHLLTASPDWRRVWRKRVKWENAAPW